MKGTADAQNEPAMVYCLQANVPLGVRCVRSEERLQGEDSAELEKGHHTENLIAEVWKTVGNLHTMLVLMRVFGSWLRKS